MALVQPVILSGGSGTRLWPLSRASRPKQLQALTGERTMLQLTADRVRDRSSFAPPIIVASARHANAIEEQLGGSGDSIKLILEPVARNTAPAIALAAQAVAPDAPLLVMPSDHAIADEAAFHAGVSKALAAAEQGWLATFGIRPEHPETGYGYIERDEELFEGVYSAKRFVEKPSADAANAYLAEGTYSWNGGIFLFRAGDYLAELEKHAPAVLEAAEKAMNAGAADGARFYPDEAAFAASPNISIDYAVMERADRVAVVPVDIGWSDIGSWDALQTYLEAVGVQDGEEPVLLDSSGCFVRSTGPTVTAVGVDDLIIVASGDAVLVMRRGESQRVRDIVEELKRRGSPLAD